MDTRREPNLLSWQYSLYPRNHRRRGNLVVHILTVPLFMAGTAATALGWLQPWLLAIGPAALITAVALQGRGHKRETEPPVPFSGPLDAVARLFVEQWITFPRFVMSGGFARAWREGSET